MPASPLKTALEDLLKAHRLQSEAPLLRGERRFSPLPTGIAVLDELLGGGFPRGQVSEVYGPASSGRTGMLLSTVARSLRGGALAAWVDPGDRFDPGSAAESGVELARLLWLRGSSRNPTLPRAISATGTLLGSGLFELVVLDVAGTPGSDLARLPHSTWLRLQRTVEAGTTALVIMAVAHVAQGPGGVSLRLAGGGRWSGTGPGRLLSGLEVEATAGPRRRRGACFDLQAFA